MSRNAPDASTILTASDELATDEQGGGAAQPSSMEPLAAQPATGEPAAPSSTPDDSSSRRNFLGAAAGVVGAGLVTACGGDGGGSAGGPAVVTRPNVNWRLASSFPRGLDAIFGSAEMLGHITESLTDGRFRIRAYPAGELVPGLQVMDAVQQGTVQVGQSTSYYYTGKNQALAFDAGVPFGMTARQQDAWLTEGGGLDVIRGVFSDFGILSFPAGNTGGQMGGWFRREVNTAEDLRGLKMRIPGLGGDVMDRMGVTVQVLAGGDIYPALERGAIDATEWVGPYDDEKLGLHQAAPYYYYPGWWEPCASMSYQVNQQAWDRLPTEYQAVFEVAARSSARRMLAFYDAHNPAALQRLIAGGTQMRSFSDDIMALARTTIGEILDDYSAADAQYREVYDHWRNFRDASFGWFGTSELRYASFAFNRTA